MRVDEKSRKIPALMTDEEAEAFLQRNLSGFDFSQFKPLHLEFEKAAQMNMRVPRALLEAVKVCTKAPGIPYTRYIRELMARDISRARSK